MEPVNETLRFAQPPTTEAAELLKKVQDANAYADYQFGVNLDKEGHRLRSRDAGAQLRRTLEE